MIARDGQRARQKSIITLTTDFGTSDHFVGAMKGVILSINPGASLIDITHDIQTGNIRQAAFCLYNFYNLTTVPTLVKQNKLFKSIVYLIFVLDL